MLTCHPTCKLEDTIFRGGWEAKGFCRAFCYIGGILQPVSNAGRALSGWKDSKIAVIQPDCSTIPVMFDTQVENLIVKLFHCSVTDMCPRGKLWPLAKCLFATFLMHMSEMRIKYPHHMALKAMSEKCSECDLPFVLLLSWGDEIKNKFLIDNVRAVIDDGESLLPIALERIVILENNGKKHQEVSYR